VRIEFNNAGEAHAFKPIVTGFLTRQKDGTFVEFGRPTGLAVAKDGALLVGHDSTGLIYRISYHQGAGQANR
jgi:glucose/arabinose dehydrogenase